MAPMAACLNAISLEPTAWDTPSSSTILTPTILWPVSKPNGDSNDNSYTAPGKLQHLLAMHSITSEMICKWQNVNIIHLQHVQLFTVDQSHFIVTAKPLPPHTHTHTHTPLSQASRNPFSMAGMKLFGMFIPTVSSSNTCWVSWSPVSG